MKNHKILLSAFLAIFFAGPVTAQPIIDWETETAIGEGASDVTAFMDYVDDFCMSMWVGAGVEANIKSISPDGTTNFFDIWFELDFIAGGIHNLGTTSNVLSLNSNTNTLIQYLIDNNTGTVLHTFTITIPFIYSQAKFITSRQLNIDGTETTGVLLKVLDSSDNLYKSLLVIIEKDPLDNYSQEIHPILGFVRNSTPTSMLLTNTDFFIWGYVDKNTGGTTHDNFIAKVHNDGEIYAVVYQKILYSYAGRDDVAKNIVMDVDGNIYGISHSEDNVSPFYDHIAVFKINPANGKRLWIRRLGEGTLAHEVACDAAGNKMGDGLAITGSVSDGAGGRNARTWRLNSSGTTLWIKTINQTGPGTIEEGRKINFCLGSGDFNIMGYRNSDDNFFIARYNTTSGLGAWPVEIYNGDFAGQIVDGSMVLGSSLSSDIYCTYLTLDGLNYSMATTKFSQPIMKQETDIADAENFNIYPNPSSDYIYLNGTDMNARIQILNMNGQIVLEQQTDTANPVFDIRSLPQGYYSCRIYTDEELQTISFIKAK